MADKKPQSNVARPIPSTMAANKNPESNEAHPLPPVFPIPLPMPGTNISIREQMTAVTFRHYIINFFGTQLIHVYVTADPFVADCWVNETLHLHHNHLNHLVAGFGVQWNSATYTTSTGEALLVCDYAATLQICVGKCCLIYQLAHAPYVTALLLRFLQTTTLVGLWNDYDARMLWECKHRMQIRVPLDMTLYVKKGNGDNFANNGSMEEIAHFCLGLEGVRMDHEISKMDWSARVLSPDQVQQACVQAYVSCLIGLKHKAWNFDNGLLYPIPRI